MEGKTGPCASPFYMGILNNCSDLEIRRLAPYGRDRRRGCFKRLGTVGDASLAEHSARKCGRFRLQVHFFSAFIRPYQPGNVYLSGFAVCRQMELYTLVNAILLPSIVSRVLLTSEW